MQKYKDPNNCSSIFKSPIQIMIFAFKPFINSDLLCNPADLNHGENQNRLENLQEIKFNSTVEREWIPDYKGEPGLWVISTN